MPGALLRSDNLLVLMNVLNETNRDRIANATSRFPRLALDGVRTGKAPVLRLVLGSVFVLAGMIGLLVINDALITGRVIREVLFAL